MHPPDWPFLPHHPWSSCADSSRCPPPAACTPFHSLTRQTPPSDSISPSGIEKIPNRISNCNFVNLEEMLDDTCLIFLKPMHGIGIKVKWQLRIGDFVRKN
jgi:hypothetical protein